MYRSFKYLWILLVITQANAQFADDFTDGEIVSNPQWVGQTDRFIVSNGELQLNAEAIEGESYLVTQSAGLDNGVWEFRVRMAFGTSGSNYCKVYLMSTKADLTGALNGYYVLIGQTADEISLVRQDGSNEVVIIDGVDKLIDASSVDVRVKVTRDANGNWELLHDITGGSTFQSGGTVTDDTYRITEYFGVHCIYTSTRSDKFFFDDFAVTGTPILDEEPPTILSAEAINANSVRLTFSEEIDPVSVQSADFSIDKRITVTGVSVSNATVNLTTSNLTNGRTYEVLVNGISDLAGNELTDGQSIFRYLVFSDAEREDILLTEVLFNPKTDAVDFIELYNNTADKYFDLQDFHVARILNDELDQVRKIYSEELVLEPGRYLALSEDASILAFEYPSGDANNFVTIDDLPSYNDDEGTVVFLSPDLDTLQFFHYQEDFHYDLLEDEEGVSLERIVLGGDENDPNLWRSAASTEGFATPGKANSQSLESIESPGQLTIEPKVFLPGNSGSGRDFTTINYELKNAGQFANVTIYDQNGRPVKRLASGASLSTTGFLRWDGTTDSGSLARMGYHIIVFEMYDGSGNTKTLRETVVVGREL